MTPLGTNDDTREETHPRSSSSTAVNLDALFDEAWSAWPKKVDRKDALAGFKIAARKFRGREEQLVAAIQLHGKAHRLYTEPKFIPGLRVWLNKERWDNPVPGPEGPAKPTAKDPNAWMQPKRPTPPRVAPAA